MKSLVLPVLLCALVVPAVHAQTFDPSANALVENLNTISGETAAGDAQPTTMPFTAYSNGHCLVHVSGVLTVDGQPVPNALVDVTAELHGGFVAEHLVRTDVRGVYNDWFQANAPIQWVNVEPLVANTETTAITPADALIRPFPTKDAQ